MSSLRYFALWIFVINMDVIFLNKRLLTSSSKGDNRTEETMDYAEIEIFFLRQATVTH